MSDDKYAQSKPIDALNSRGLTGKREYVRGLEQRADAEALSLLIECLCDESWYLRDQAEQALLRIGPDIAAGVLLPMPEQGPCGSRTPARHGTGGRFGHRRRCRDCCGWPGRQRDRGDRGARRDGADRALGVRSASP
jgi:hypothetical protein